LQCFRWAEVPAFKSEAYDYDCIKAVRQLTACQYLLCASKISSLRPEKLRQFAFARLSSVALSLFCDIF